MGPWTLQGGACQTNSGPAGGVCRKQLGPVGRAFRQLLGPAKVACRKTLCPVIMDIESLLFLQGTTHETQKPHKFGKTPFTFGRLDIDALKSLDMSKHVSNTPPTSFRHTANSVRHVKKFTTWPSKFCHVETRILEAPQKLVKPIPITCCGVLISCGFRRV